MGFPLQLLQFSPKSWICIMEIKNEIRNFDKTCTSIIFSINQRLGFSLVHQRGNYQYFLPTMMLHLRRKLNNIHINDGTDSRKSLS